jgi:hypothetical protein
MSGPADKPAQLHVGRVRDGVVRARNGLAHAYFHDTRQGCVHFAMRRQQARRPNRLLPTTRTRELTLVSHLARSRFCAVCVASQDCCKYAPGAVSCGS